MDGFEHDDHFIPVSFDMPSKLENCLDQTAAYRLRNVMENISEDYYAAGWLMGLEYMLFNAVYAGEDFATQRLTHDEISQIFLLSQQCQGWWMWNEHERRRFVPFDEWFLIYAEWHQSY